MKQKRLHKLLFKISDENNAYLNGINGLIKTDVLNSLLDYCRKNKVTFEIRSSLSMKGDIKIKI